MLQNISYCVIAIGLFLLFGYILQYLLFGPSKKKMNESEPKLLELSELNDGNYRIDGWNNPANGKDFWLIVAGVEIHCTWDRCDIKSISMNSHVKVSAGCITGTL